MVKKPKTIVPEKEFQVEYNKSAKSTCRCCGDKLPKGELRMAKVVGDGADEWHHIYCFNSKRSELGFSDEMNVALAIGFGDLELDDQQRVTMMLSQKPVVASSAIQGESSTSLTKGKGKKGKPAKEVEAELSEPKAEAANTRGKKTTKQVESNQNCDEAPKPTGKSRGRPKKNENKESDVLSGDDVEAAAGSFSDEEDQKAAKPRGRQLKKATKKDAVNAGSVIVDASGDAGSKMKRNNVVESELDEDLPYIDEDAVAEVVEQKPEGKRSRQPKGALKETTVKADELAEEVAPVDTPVDSGVQAKRPAAKGKVKTVKVDSPKPKVAPIASPEKMFHEDDVEKVAEKKQTKAKKGRGKEIESTRNEAAQVVSPVKELVKSHEPSPSKILSPTKVAKKTAGKGKGSESDAALVMEKSPIVQPMESDAAVFEEAEAPAAKVSKKGRGKAVKASPIAPKSSVTEDNEELPAKKKAKSKKDKVVSDEGTDNNPEQVVELAKEEVTGNKRSKKGKTVENLPPAVEEGSTRQTRATRGKAAAGQMKQAVLKEKWG